jgi:hypothetical protein
MDLAEAYVQHCIKYVLATCADDMQLLESGSKIFEVLCASVLALFLNLLFVFGVRVGVDTRLNHRTTEARCRTIWSV